MYLHFKEELHYFYCIGHNIARSSACHYLGHYVHYYSADGGWTHRRRAGAAAVASR